MVDFGLGLADEGIPDQTTTEAERDQSSDGNDREEAEDKLCPQGEGPKTHLSQKSSMPEPCSVILLNPGPSGQGLFSAAGSANLLGHRS
jgi:hypothetical protein